MGEPVRVALAVVLIVVGVVAAVYAGYLQYAALPEEHTFAKGGKRLALALGGLALIVGASELLP
ncbi:hypothetical protein SAMN05660209_03801 [Geodermatophilus africanus]|uniref:Uncharacterized protein n=1 Tax=Geodermatophilus africanus TaxID=1137993 RepID=A0A1H3N237_9ACTN|nr:hypothetical protein [Geodermatophilus africanus]SDY82299.1 hypothetical protein SAMN05660209_03801 [Geodermatophilus africanus]